MAASDATPWPIKNQAYRVTFPILDADGDLVTGATGLDSEVSKDAGAFADCTSEATEIATSSGVYYLDLTATEMDADTVAIIVKTSSSGAKTTTMVLYPITNGLDLPVNVTYFGGSAGTFSGGRPEVNATHFAGTAYATALAAEVDAVWDEVLTAAAHNVANSAGRRLRTLDAITTHDGTAQAGAANSITLAAGASATDRLYNFDLISIIGGTGVGQSRLIVNYNGTSKVAIVNRNWVTNPDNTSEYIITANSEFLIENGGLAAAGGATTITLNSIASATDDIYNGSMVLILTGTGAGQTRIITDYAGATKVATVTNAWATNPDTTSAYVVIPVGRALVVDFLTGAIDADAIAVGALEADAFASGAILDSAGVATAVWNAATASYGGAGTYGQAIEDILQDTGTDIPASLTTIDDFLDTEIAAIKAKTDSLTFTQAGHVDANIQRINDVAITGDGSGSPFNV